MRVGVLTKGELSPGHHPLGPGRRGRGAGRGPRLDRPAPGRHAWPPVPGCATSTRCACWWTRGPDRVNELIALGAMFDRDEQGRLELAREGGHSLARVVHAGGAATGAEIERALVEAVRAHGGRRARERLRPRPADRRDGRCRGVVARDAQGAVRVVEAANVLLATGGAGQLFAVTTNPVESTGDGIAMALRAGVAVADVEFVQFHPTALHHPEMPRPLLSEALRGHGALHPRQPRRAVRRRAAAPRRGGPGHHPAHARPGRRPPVARRHRPRALRRALPDHRRGAGPSAGSTRPATGCPSPRPPTTCRGGVVTDLDGASSLARAVGRGRGVLLGRARRQPPGLQLAARGHGVRRPGGRGHRGRAHVGPSRPAPCAPCSTPTSPTGRRSPRSTRR